MARRIIIPARMASTRLPGKMLLDIDGKPMLQRTYERARECNADSVLIAADPDIAKVASTWGADVCITAPEHATGTDRLAEAATIKGYDDDDLIVNIQGDEPLIPVANVHQVFEDLASHPKADIATLMDKLNDLDDILSPHAVKVVTDKNGYALYFSRAPIPWGQNAMPDTLPDKSEYWLHIGIYGYRCQFLKQFTKLAPAPLEAIEKLEQLRALWHGHKIHVSPAPEPNPPGIDTEAGLARVRKLFATRV